MSPSFAVTVAVVRKSTPRSREIDEMRRHGGPRSNPRSANLGQMIVMRRVPDDGYDNLDAMGLQLGSLHDLESSLYCRRP